MPDWKELDHKFYKIVDGDHRMIEYVCDWMAQFHDVKRAWVWFDILCKGVSLSNAKEHLKQIKKRRETRKEEACYVRENNNNNRNRDHDKHDSNLDEKPSKINESSKSKKKSPEQGNLFD